MLLLVSCSAIMHVINKLNVNRQQTLLTLCQSLSAASFNLLCQTLIHWRGTIWIHYNEAFVSFWFIFFVIPDRKQSNLAVALRCKNKQNGSSQKPIFHLKKKTHQNLVEFKTSDLQCLRFGKCVFQKFFFFFILRRMFCESLYLAKCFEFVFFEGLFGSLVMFFVLCVYWHNVFSGTFGLWKCCRFPKKSVFCLLLCVLMCCIL